MNNIRYSILVIDNNPDRIKKLKKLLASNDQAECEIYSTPDFNDNAVLLKANPPDIVILNPNSSGSHSSNTFNDITETFPDSPVIILVDTDDSDTGSKHVNHGAQDYLNLDDLSVNCLYHVLSNSIIRNRLIGEARKRGEAFEKLVMISQDPVIVIDEKYNINICNKKFREMLKIPGDIDTADMNLSDYIVESDQIRFRNDIDTNIDSNDSKIFEYEVISSDHQNYKTEIVISPLRTISDQQRQFLLVIKDSASGKRAEIALRESEAWYRTLFEDSRDAIYISTRDGKFLDINQAGIDLFGYERSELIGLSTEELYNNPSDRAKFMDDIEEKGSVRDYEVRLKKKDGSEMICLLTTTIKEDDHGNIIGYQGIIHDISEFKRNYDLLQHRIEFDKLVTAISTHFINLATSEIDRGIIDALRGIGKFTGVDRSYVVLYNSDKQTFKKTHEWAIAKVKPVLELNRTYNLSDFPWYADKLTQGEPVGFNSLSDIPILADQELIQLKKTGVKSILLVPMWYGGKIVGFLGFDTITREKRWNQEHLSLLKLVGEIFINAIQIKKTQNALKNSEEQLRQAQKMEAIGQLAGGVAHDFNNLLTVIAGHTELAMMSLDRKDPLYQSVEQIQRASESASNLTRQLLAFSRKQTLEKQIINLNDVIGDMSRMLKRIIGENIALQFKPGDNLWSVETDPSQLGHVIINLAVNAKDAMPDGGHLCIETRNQELDEEYILTHPSKLHPGKYVIISVSDSGEGIPKDIQNRVFDPFFTTKEAGKGTGLGLSMAYGVIQQSGGDIWLYSEPGKGCTFNLFLPRVVIKDIKKVKKAVLSEIPGGNESVLVIEDEDGVRQMVQRVLEKAGYDVIAANSGTQALTLTRQKEGSIDLIITDIVMPNMSGPQIYDLLKNRYKQVRALFMSGYTADNAIQQGLMKPNAHYIQKPFKLFDLARKVREVLDSDE